MGFLRFIFCVFVIGFPAYSFAQTQDDRDVPYDESDSVVRYDVIEDAKSMMSCAGYDSIFAEGLYAEQYIGEAKWMFVADGMQTEEEIASWIAGAYGLYVDYWQRMKTDDDPESARIIAQEKAACHERGIAKNIIQG